MKNLPLAEIIDMIIKVIKFFKRKKKHETQTDVQKEFEKNLQTHLWSPQN